MKSKTKLNAGITAKGWFIIGQYSANKLISLKSALIPPLARSTQDLSSIAGVIIQGQEAS